MVTERGYGKINISLSINGVKDGFHMLDSICVTVDKFDEITIKKRKDDKILLTTLGPYGKYNIMQEEYNAYKAGVIFKERYKTCGFDIIVKRNIPEGSGMGGSSADISGTINALRRLFEVKDDCKDIADSLGSDSGYLLTGGYARLTGRGNFVKKIDSNLQLYFVVIYGKNSINTAECFKKYDELNEKLDIKTDLIERAILEKDFSLFVGNGGNDLTKPATMIDDEIKDNLMSLKDLSPFYCDMTGSGSTVYAMYDNLEMAKWAEWKLKKKYGKNVEILYSLDKI